MLYQRYGGLKVIPYTVDDEQTMQRLIDLGVDGLISDDPNLPVLVASATACARKLDSANLTS